MKQQMSVLSALLAVYVHVELCPTVSQASDVCMGNANCINHKFPSSLPLVTHITPKQLVSVEDRVSISCHVQDKGRHALGLYFHGRNKEFVKLMALDTHAYNPMLDVSGGGSVFNFTIEMLTTDLEGIYECRTVSPRPSAMQTRITINACNGKKGYMFYEQTDSCYKFYSGEPKNWFDARQHCRKDGVDLVTIMSAAENHWIRTQVLRRSQGARGWWIGLSDLSQERGTRKDGWIWVDGKSPTYLNWRARQPDGQDWGEQVTKLMRQDYVEFTTYGWGDEMGVFKNPFICKGRL